MKPHFTRDQLKPTTPALDEDGNRVSIQVTWPDPDDPWRHIDYTGEDPSLPECRLARSGKAFVQCIDGKYYIFENGKLLQPA